jgi:hypothetical protein
MRTTARALTASLLAAVTLLVAGPAVAAPPPAMSVAVPSPAPEPDPAPPTPAPALTANPATPGLPEPTLTVLATSVAEGDDGTVDMVFAVTTPVACDQDMDLLYDVEPSPADPAQDGLDFDEVIHEPFHIPAGVTHTSISVPIHGDLEPEIDEGIALTIHDVEGCDALPSGQAAALGIILDDDGQVVSIDDVEVVEGDAGTTDATFQVCLEDPALIDYSLSVGFGPGTATPGDDIDNVILPVLVFLVGDQCNEIAIPVRGDTEVEDDETVTLSLYDGSFGLEIAKSLGTLTILDDDEEPILATPPADPDDDDDSDDEPTDEPVEEPEMQADTSHRTDLPRTGATVAGLSLLGAALVAAGRALTAAAARHR